MPSGLHSLVGDCHSALLHHNRHTCHHIFVNDKKRILPWGPSKGQTLFRTGPMVHNHVNRMRSGRHTVPGHIHGITLMNGNKRIIMAAGALMLTAAMIFSLSPDYKCARLDAVMSSARPHRPVLSGMRQPKGARLTARRTHSRSRKPQLHPTGSLSLSVFVRHALDIPRQQHHQQNLPPDNHPRALIAVALAMLAWMAVRNIAGC